MIEPVYKTEMVEKEVVDTENSHIYCDYCEKEIPMNSRFYHVCTGHHDWGMDSCDSIEYKQFCSSNCLARYIEYVYTDKHGLHRSDSQYLDIRKDILNETYINCYSKD